MKILFDNGTPAPLRRYLYGQSVDTAARMGWATLRNGDLLARAEENGYDLIITTGQQWPHQLNLDSHQARPHPRIPYGTDSNLPTGEQGFTGGA